MIIKSILKSFYAIFLFLLFANVTALAQSQTFSENIFILQDTKISNFEQVNVAGLNVTSIINKNENTTSIIYVAPNTIIFDPTETLQQIGLQEKFVITKQPIPRKSLAPANIVQENSEIISSITKHYKPLPFGGMPISDGKYFLNTSITISVSPSQKTQLITALNTKFESQTQLCLQNPHTVFGNKTTYYNTCALQANTTRPPPFFC